MRSVTATLPDGLVLEAPSQFEADVLYREIVVERTYERHGIQLAPNAVVFDIGANMGLFTIHVARTIEGVRVHAFEPIAEMFAILQRNLSAHAPTAVARQIAIADRDGEAVFEVDRFAMMASTMRPRVFDVQFEAAAGESAEAALGDLARLAPHDRTVEALRRGLTRPLIRPAVVALMASALAALRLRRRLYLKRETYELRTLSRALAESGVDAVDLVKIDVEGAEESVVAGIADADWPRLRQFVIEVHDVDGRLERMASTLERRGYRTVRAREDWSMHELLKIWTLYAIRA